MITEKEISIIENRLKNSTKGPWISYIEGRDHTSGCNFIKTEGEDFEISGARIEDFDFIANAKQDIPYLIKEIRELIILLKKH